MIDVFALNASVTVNSLTCGAWVSNSHPMHTADKHVHSIETLPQAYCTRYNDKTLQLTRLYHTLSHQTDTHSTCMLISSLCAPMVSCINVWYPAVIYHD